ncbi:MAG: DUF5063 domain-containing protein [Bacteroidales bacterium 36-12]|nr:MAG: DUF5063 domain-containing protein [Bacteroidales bacterium 36-12]
MKLEGLPDHFVYSPATIEFMTVVAETCLFLEKSIELSRKEFVEKGVNILSLLYLKTSILEIPERSYDDETERFVTEDDYNYIKSQIEVLLGDKDTYLETFHPDMVFSDTPIAAFISENMADIYQELKDLAANYQLGETEIMNDAIATCLEAFGEHWGQKLLNALRAIHNIKYSNQDEDSEDESTHYHKDIDRNDYIDFLRDDDF